MSRRFKFEIDTGYPGAGHEDEIEIPDELTDEREVEAYCEEFAREMMGNCIDIYWEEIKDDDNDRECEVIPDDGGEG